LQGAKLRRNPLFQCRAMDAFAPSPQVQRRTRRFGREYGSLFGRPASNRPNLFHSATAMRRGLRSGTSLERNAPESVTPTVTRYVHRNISRWRHRGDTRSSLKRLHKQRGRGEIVKGRSRIRSGQESRRFIVVAVVPAGCRRPCETHNHRRPLVAPAATPSHSKLHGRGVWVPAFAGTTAERERRRKPQFVFATLGGAAVVMNDVASSIAWPNGVGMVMRNGTRTRVPAIGTNAISIRRSVARYLMTGRSGI